MLLPNTGAKRISLDFEAFIYLIIPPSWKEINTLFIQDTQSFLLVN